MESIRYTITNEYVLILLGICSQTVWYMYVICVALQMKHMYKHHNYWFT